MPLRGIRRVLGRFFDESSSEPPDRRPDFIAPEIYSDDVFLVSYPRSGSTWVRFVLTYLMLGRFDDSVDFQTVQEVTPDIQMVKPSGISLDVPRPRVIKSHAAFVPDYPNVVYLLRDGRDVVVSFYYYCRKRSGYDGSLYDFIEANCDYHVSWSEHVESWLAGQHDMRFLCIRYEDLLADGLAVMRNVCSFAGISATDDEIAEALRLSRFSRLRRLEEDRGLGYVDGGDEQYRFIRKGEKGDWTSHFDARTKRVFKRLHQPALEKLGYADSSNW